MGQRKEWKGPLRPIDAASPAAGGDAVWTGLLEPASAHHGVKDEVSQAQLDTIRHVHILLLLLLLLRGRYAAWGPRRRRRWPASSTSSRCHSNQPTRGSAGCSGASGANHCRTCGGWCRCGTGWTCTGRGAKAGRGIAGGSLWPAQPCRSHCNPRCRGTNRCLALCCCCCCRGLCSRRPPCS